MEVWVEYEVDGDFILQPPREAASLTVGPHQVTLRNRAPGEDGHSPGLWVSIVLDAESLDDAIQAAREHMTSFLDYLAFTTSVRYKIVRAVRAIEWMPKQVTRQVKFLNSFDPLQPPEPMMGDQVLGAMELLCAAKLPEAVRSALHWFRRGLLGSQPDEQFQSFWFVIEIIANHTKAMDPVPDLCAKCRTPLFCKTCGEETTHRPYPKQAIEALFRRIVNPQPDKAFDFMNDVRNQLLHGTPFRKIQTTPQKSAEWIVDHVGKTAYSALVHAITLIVRPQEKWVLIGREGFAARMIVMGARGSFDHRGSGDHPDWKELPTAKIELITKFDPISREG
jgi:hypothetical protein